MSGRSVSSASRLLCSRRGLFASVLAAQPPPDVVTRRRDGGGQEVGLLGFGAMRLPTVDGGHANPWGENTSPKSIDRKRVDAMIDLLLKHGVNYFDTSPCYCRGESEAVLGASLSRHPRTRYLLSTKLSNFAPQQFSAEASREMFENSLKALRTDFIDYYYLHSIGNGGLETFRKRYVDNGILPWLFEQKAKGRIRRLGFSYHGDPKTLEWVLARHDEGRYRWDMALIQLNYVDWRHAQEVNRKNLNAEYLYEELTRRGIAVTVMEPLLGGRLARHNDAVMSVLAPLDPEATPAKWAFRFAGSKPNVLTVLSGVTYLEHATENVATFAPLKPLAKAEELALERAAEAYLGYGAIPCTGCDYCMPCPYGLDIPGLFAFMNEVRTAKLDDPRRIRELCAARVPDPRRRADRCIGCGCCTSHCPQMIDIPKAMDSIAAFLEDLS